MQNTFTNSLLQAISLPRFSPYRAQATASSDPTGFPNYVWNIALSESLYPALQGVEITLRNSVNDSATGKFNDDNWFDHILVAPEIRSLENAKGRVRRQNKTLRSENIIAETNFGFWVGLFRRSYEQVLWPQLLREVFPYMPREIRSRSRIFQQLGRIRNLRNRISHHEPVWHWNNLEQLHQETLAVIDWINPDMLSVIETIDRFPAVYSQRPRKVPRRAVAPQQPASLTVTSHNCLATRIACL